MKWSYGVTTVPSRLKDLLPRTIKSLKLAGFPLPRLFVDGAGFDLSPWQQFYEEGMFITPRVPQTNVVTNWILSIWELYSRDPNADRYALFQDDFVTYRNLRAYLEKKKYPEKGYLNLYTFPSNQQLAPRKIGWFTAGLCNPPDVNPNLFQTGRGAVALVFSNEALVTLLQRPEFVLKRKYVAKPDTSIDGCIVAAMNMAGWREYVHNPSLTQHTGVKSTIEARHDNQLTAPSFRGEEFDALKLLEEQ